MDMEEIRYLLGGTVFARAKAYTDRIQDLNCEVAGNGVRHLSADVRGGGRSLYQTQVWLRENGSFVSASCSCPYNENGEGPCCKHIGALLMWDSESQGLSGRAPQKPAESPESIPGVVRGTANLQTPQPEEPPRRDSYASSLEMLFGKKWRGEEPESDYEARRLLRAYQEGALAEVDGVTGHAELRPHSAELEPELTLLPGELPWLRLRISADGGRQYVVKSIPDLLRAVEKHGFISYGKALEFQHSWEAFAPEAQQLLRLLRRQLSAKEGAEAALRSYGNAPRSGPAGGIPLNGEIFDGLVALYAPTGNLGGYTLKTGIPALTMRVEKRRGGVEVSVTPALGWKTGLDNDYLYSEDTIWQLDRAESARMRPALEALCGKSLFFTTGDATAFCSYVLPELGSRVTIEDPERLLLNQIPLEPVVQFYLDAPTRETVRAHLEFLYGEDRVTPEEPGPAGLLRDARAEQRAGRLLGRYLEPGPDTMGNGLAAHYDAYEEDEVYRFLDEGIPALLAEGEVYLTDAFRSMQAAPPKISVGVSVHGSVLDLEVDTGEFPVGELKALLKSLHQKKRYHRLRDGRLLRLDDSLEVLDELNETLELSGAKLGQAHARLPLYRAPSLDWALSGQNGIRFNRDDAFRQLSRSFHAVKDSEYTPPASLQKVLRKYQRDGYRWLRTLDGYGMGGILADDMGLGKTVQVLSYLLAMKESGTPDFKALTSYLALTGGKKEILEAIRENQREKFAQTPPDLMDIRRFYEARLAERTQKKDGVAGHYDRYARLRIMTDSGASYEELLAAYEEMGAGNGYKEFLLKSIKDGQIDGRQVTREDLMELEGRRVDRIGEKHLTRIDLIHQVQDQEGSYEEIYGRYMAQVEQDDPGLWKTIKNTIGKESRFERTMNKKDSGADELIAYEKMRAEEVGLKHADRLRVLLGLSDGAEDFMDAGLLQDPIVKEAKRKDYLEKSKRFKKMDQEGDLSFKDFAKQLRERQGSVLRAEILNYEKGRKQEYEARLAEIEKAEQEIQRMREELKEQTAKCHALTNAITNIKGNPESVWRELERFEETVIFLDEHKDPEAEARRTEQETEKARSQADQAIWQIDEIRAKREEE